MRIFALEKTLPGASMKKIMALSKDESIYAWDLYKKGIIREWYFRQDHPGVVLILECASVEEARAALNGLPLVQEGLIEFDQIIPVGYFRPVENMFV